jgi:hypothetical protein
MEQIVRNIMNNQLRRYRRECPLDITDRVFEIIGNRFRRQYNVSVTRQGRTSVNTGIGKLVKTFWNLQNLRKNCKSKRSDLIQTYTEHSN